MHNFNQDKNPSHVPKPQHAIINILPPSNIKWYDIFS